MKRIVSLLHRQAVRAKAEGLFFQISALNLFRTVLGDQKSFPKDQPYKDLVALINYILRQFFKAVEADSFVLIEALFPKNRNRWKKYSSWEPEPKGDGKDADPRFPPDVKVKKGYSWSEQLAIAMAALQDAGQGELIAWVKETLTVVIAQRQRIVERGSDAASDDDEENDGADATPDKAQAKTTDYVIPYTTDAQANAATKNPQLKLMFRLVHCHLRDEDADELEWYIPAGIGLPDLRRAIAVIEQFEKTPLDLGGKRAAQLLLKNRRNRRRQRPRHTSADSEGEEGSGGGEEEENGKGTKGKGKAQPSKARTARARERDAYKSAQFIEDSDEEYGHDIDGFFAREAAVRERTALAAVDSALGTGTMRTTGTKKRRRPRGRTTTAGDADADADADGGGARRAKRRAVRAPSQRGADGDSAQSESESGPEIRASDVEEQEGPAVPAARDRRPPKPRPLYRGSATTATTTGEPRTPTQREDGAQAERQTAFLALDDEDAGDQGRNVSGGEVSKQSEFARSDTEDGDDDDDESKNGRASLVQGGGAPDGSVGSGSRKGRVIIISDEE